MFLPIVMVYGINWPQFINGAVEILVLDKKELING